MQKEEEKANCNEAFVCIGWLSQEPGADCNHDRDLALIQVQSTNTVIEADRGGAY